MVGCAATQISVRVFWRRLSVLKFGTA